MSDHTCPTIADVMALLTEIRDRLPVPRPPGDDFVIVQTMRETEFKAVIREMADCMMAWKRPFQAPEQARAMSIAQEMAYLASDAALERAKALLNV